MELFVLLSFIGTVVLLSTHVLDYASECLRLGRLRASTIAQPNHTDQQCSLRLLA